MNWDAIGAIGELVGAMAVVVTLGYLAVQIRYARSEARRALSQGRGEALRSLLIEQQDERLNRLVLQVNAALGAEPRPFAVALAERTGVSAEDASLLLWNQISWWNYFLQIIPKIDDLTPMERTQFEVPIRAYYGSPGVGRVFYETYVKPQGHADAVRYIDNLLAQHERVHHDAG
jgi:hypothetical protein